MDHRRLGPLLRITLLLSLLLVGLSLGGGAEVAEAGQGPGAGARAAKGGGGGGKGGGGGGGKGAGGGKGGGKGAKPSEGGKGGGGAKPSEGSKGGGAKPSEGSGAKPSGGAKPGASKPSEGSGAKPSVPKPAEGSGPQQSGPRSSPAVPSATPAILPSKPRGSPAQGAVRLPARSIPPPPPRGAFSAGSAASATPVGVTRGLATPSPAAAVVRVPEKAGLNSAVGGPSAQGQLALADAGRVGQLVRAGGGPVRLLEVDRVRGGEGTAPFVQRVPVSRDPSPITALLPALGRPGERPLGARQGVENSHYGADPRTSRPNPVQRRPHPEAGAQAPQRRGYGPHYVRWWSHPYWRYQSCVTIVVLGGALYPWAVGWMGPPRDGYIWVEDQSWAGWVPGSYAPATVAPEFGGVAYVWVDGFWVGETYIDGFWRPERRLDGAWVWVDGAYDTAGVYHPGYWEPADAWPEGMTWEPGFFDGHQWVEGFWRPAARAGFLWVEARMDSAGVRQAGHWLSLESRPGSVWVPGWFDGHRWVEDGWAPIATVQAVDLGAFEPAAGVNAGADQPRDEPSITPSGELPLAVPLP